MLVFFFLFISKLFNITGISCFLVTKNGEFRLSNWMCAINLTKQLLLIGLAIYIIRYVDLSNFLDDDQKLSMFTPFTLTMFNIVGQLPILASNYLVLSHFLKRSHICSFLRDLIKIYDNFIPMHHHDFFGSKKKFFKLLALYLLAFKLSNIFLLFKCNIWVIVAYSTRFYYEMVVNSFLFAFIVFVKLMTFLVESLNYRLKFLLFLRCYVPADEHAFDEISEFYEIIYNTMADFNRIFQRQISYFITYMIVRVVVTVSSK